MVRRQLIARHLIADSYLQTVNRRDSSTLRHLTARQLNGRTFNRTSVYLEHATNLRHIIDTSDFSHRTAMMGTNMLSPLLSSALAEVMLHVRLHSYYLSALFQFPANLAYISASK